MYSSSVRSGSRISGKGVHVYKNVELEPLKIIVFVKT